MASKADRRVEREKALKQFNALASEFAEAPVIMRCSAEEAAELYGSLAAAMPKDRRPELIEAAKLWTSNGGKGEFPTWEEEADWETGEDQALAAHTSLTEGKGFRLRSKAFMLTFNARVFTMSEALWNEFQEWVEKKLKEFGGAYWSATLEQSLHSDDEGRIHLHCYLSWHGAASKGIDHRTTNAFLFHGVRPRVDCNTECRGPFHWLKATQHGHFYTAVMKQGSCFAATNYPAWGGLWIPEEAWVKSLWRQHKLTHEQYMCLSIKLRDGHDRRKACVEAVVAAELSQNYAEEKAAARKMIEMAAKPFKPLPDAVQKWKQQYTEPAERYQMLVLHGPSCTGEMGVLDYLSQGWATKDGAQRCTWSGPGRHAHAAILTSTGLGVCN